MLLEAEELHFLSKRDSSMYCLAVCTGNRLWIKIIVSKLRSLPVSWGGGTKVVESKTLWGARLSTTCDFDWGRDYSEITAYITEESRRPQVRP